MTILIYSGFLARKVQIYNDRIVYKGLNKKSQINFKDIQSIGVFIQLRNNAILLEPEKINKYSIYGVKFIYISTIKNPELRNKNSDDFICFQYRRKAYELLKSQLN